MVNTDDGTTVPTERLLDAIDEQTLLVPVSHVIFQKLLHSGCESHHRESPPGWRPRGAGYFQSLGTVPVDVQALNVDFTCGGV